MTNWSLRPHLPLPEHACHCDFVVWRRVGICSSKDTSMGWRGQQNREDDEEARWRQLPFRERYNWRVVFTSIGSAIVVLIFIIWSQWQ
nr:Hypothetical protein SC2p1_01990 [Methylocystis sp. SC2]